MQAEASSDVLDVAVTVEPCWHRVPGGTARAVVGLVGALHDRDDVQAWGLAARHDAPPMETYRLPPDFVVAHSRLPRRLMYESWHRRRGQAVVGPGGRTPDVVHAAGGVIAPTGGAPLVATVHDVAFLHRPEHFTRNGRLVLNRALHLARTEAAAVVCPSTATADDLLVQGFRSDQLHIVPLAVDEPRHTASSAAPILERLGIRGRYVLWVGTIEPRKNLHRLLDAFARAADDDVQLVLAGPDGWKEALPPMLADGSDRLVCTGFVSDDDLSALYAGADLLCLPSLLEGFGFPVAEAMAHGTPVVTSTGTSTEELVGSAGVCVDPTDSTALAAAMAEVLEDSALARRLGDAGRERATALRWPAYADRIVDIYRQVTT